MEERVEILRKLYPNCLILVKYKDKIKFVGIDKNIIDTFGYENLKNVNKIILDNLEIVKYITYDNNLYEEYYLKTKLIELINGLRKELIIKCKNE